MVFDTKVEFGNQLCRDNVWTLVKRQNHNLINITTPLHEFELLIFNLKQQMSKKKKNLCFKI